MAKKRLPVAKPSTVEVAKPYPQTKEQRDRERRYAAEDALRAIQRAEEVKANKSLMADVKALANEQVNNLKKFCK